MRRTISHILLRVLILASLMAMVAMPAAIAVDHTHRATVGIHSCCHSTTKQCCSSTHQMGTCEVSASSQTAGRCPNCRPDSNSQRDHTDSPSNGCDGCNDCPCCAIPAIPIIDTAANVGCPHARLCCSLDTWTTPVHSRNDSPPAPVPWLC